MGIDQSPMTYSWLGNEPYVIGHWSIPIGHLKEEILPQPRRYVIVEIGKCAFYKVGIELGTRASPHFFGGLSKGNRFVVRALVDHRIDAIHNREHARAEWNILAL